MLFSSPQEHRDNPPSTWTVRKHGRRWGLHANSDNPLCSFDTKHEAEAAKTTGFHAELYAKESRWYAGANIPGWKPYSAIVIEHLLRACKQVLRDIPDHQAAGTWADLRAILTAAIEKAEGAANA